MRNPLNILDRIYAHKLHEVAERKFHHPVRNLERSSFFSSAPFSMKAHIEASSSGIIAEYKRQSPSRGIINNKAAVEQVSNGYMKAGAAGLSVLTDNRYFGGSFRDMEKARVEIQGPILQKDFIVDEYQVVEARSYGADAILLIAAILDKKMIHHLTSIARSLGMEVLLEMHQANELDKMDPQVNLVGINNRNLQHFDVQLSHAVQLADMLPDGYTRIAESGIDQPQTAFDLLEKGFDGLLIGEAFMREARPDKACYEFIRDLELLYRNHKGNHYED